MSSAEPASPTPNRFERRRQQNRAALIDAAIELFQQQGVRGTKVEDICERADVSPRTFFNHFDTREHLYEAIARQRADQFVAVVDEACEAPEPFAVRLRTLFVAIGEALDARPLYRELVCVMLTLGVDGNSEIVRTRPLGRAARRFVESGIARGEITGRHDSAVIADIVIGALNAAITNWSASEEFSLARNLDAAARALGEFLERRAEDGAPPDRL